MIKKLRKIRQEKGLTQTQLAKLSGVSQSLIARIEQGKIDPGYSKAQRIIAALDSTSKSFARDIMIKNIHTISISDKIEKAISIMKEEDISQLPVVKQGKIVGSISESSITLRNPNAQNIRNIIEPSLPTVDQNAPVELIRDLLKHSQAVIVTNEGRPIGIVSKADLLRLI